MRARAFSRRHRGALLTSSTVPLPLLDMLDVARPRYDAVTSDTEFQRTQLIRNARASSRRSGRHGRGERKRYDPHRFATGAASIQWRRVRAEWADALHALAREALAYLDADAGAELLNAAAANVPRPDNFRHAAVARSLHGGRGSRRPHHGGCRRTVDRRNREPDVSSSRSRPRCSAGSQLTNPSASSPSMRRTMLCGDLRSTPEIRLMLALAKERRTPVHPDQSVRFRAMSAVEAVESARQASARGQRRATRTTSHGVF